MTNRIHTAFIVSLTIFCVLVFQAQAGDESGGDTCSVPLRSTYNTSSSVYEMHKSGSTFFLLVHGSGVVALDVSDPLNPTLLDSYPASGENMKLVGNTLYLIQRNPTKFSALDVSDPSNISLISEHPLLDGGAIVPDAGLGIDVVGSLLYATYIGSGPGGLTSGLTIIDISDLQNPIYIANRTFTMNELWFPDTIIVEGSHAYLQGFVGPNTGLSIIDLANQINLPQVGFIPQQWTYDFKFHNGLLYITGPTTQILEYSDPTAPTVLAEFPEIANSRRISFSGSKAYVGNNDCLKEYDISTPLLPQFVICYESFTPSIKNILEGSVLYSASLEGLEVLYTDDCDLVCGADFNGDGILNFVDVSGFISLYAAQDPRADLNGDGTINFLDVSSFIFIFSLGC